MKKLMYLLLPVVLFIACDPDPIDEGPDEEIITTLLYTLTPTTGDPVVLSFSDIDGESGNDPIISGGTLSANTTYSGSLELLNESESPAEDITEEIAEEDEEHQFFFATTIADLTVAYADQDEDGNPIGLSTTVTTGATSAGTVTITLRHQPNKGGESVSDGDITNAGGETDIEVEFPITVE